MAAMYACFVAHIYYIHAYIHVKSFFHAPSRVKSRRRFIHNNIQYIFLTVARQQVYRRTTRPPLRIIIYIEHVCDAFRFGSVIMSIRRTQVDSEYPTTRPKSRTRRRLHPVPVRNPARKFEIVYDI